MEPPRPPKVVILGGGFGGLYCARALRRTAAAVTLVDRSNFHLFQPLLYQVATASLSPGDIATPLRHVLRRQDDVESRTVVLADGRLGYDYLVVATGATHAYFGHDEWAEWAPGLKTVEDAVELRGRFLAAFEAAEREADAAARRRHLTFVVVGAGPTGVELAGAMAEIARRDMPRDFRAIDTTTARILLLEGSPRVLPTYPKSLSAKARRQLERFGVEVRTDAFVTRIEQDAVYVGDERIEAANAFWAAGVAASRSARGLARRWTRPGGCWWSPSCRFPATRRCSSSGTWRRSGRTLG